MSDTTLLYEMSTIFVTMLRDESTIIMFIEGSMLGMLDGDEVGDGGEDKDILYYHLILFYLQIKFA
jgi:hypothetical protein